MKTLDPVRKLSMADQVVARLRDEILAGRLAPGDHLPPERELAVLLGTNRSTLREAVRSLEARGLVRVRQGDGVAVRDFRREGELHLLPDYLAGAVAPKERRRALEDALAMRSLVLAEAAALAAERAGPDEDGFLAAAQREASVALGADDRARLMRADLAFHRALVDASGSVVVIWSFNTLVRVFEELVSRLPELWVVPPDYLRSLGRLVRAVAGRRPGVARRAMADHLAHGDRLLLGAAEPGGGGRRGRP